MPRAPANFVQLLPLPSSSRITRMSGCMPPTAGWLLHAVEGMHPDILVVRLLLGRS